MQEPNSSLILIQSPFLEKERRDHVVLATVLQDVVLLRSPDRLISFKKLRRVHLLMGIVHPVLPQDCFTKCWIIFTYPSLLRLDRVADAPRTILRELDKLPLLCDSILVAKIIKIVQKLGRICAFEGWNSKGTWKRHRQSDYTCRSL